VTASSASDISRLTSLVERQRRELDRLRAQAAARSVVDIAQGMLMERLGCTPAEAAGQLARLARESGTPLTELAADVTGQHLARGPGTPAGADTEPDGPDGLAPDGEVIQATGLAESSDPGTAGNGSDPGWRRLGLASAALPGAADGDEVAAVALDQALAPVGAQALAFWLVEPDGSLELAGQAGLGMAEAARWRHLPPDMDCLPQRVAHRGNEILWPTGPPPDDPVAVLGGRPGGAQAALPLPGSRSLAGVMWAMWPEPVAGFDSPMRRQLAAIADLCARTLDSAGPDGGGSPVAADHRASWLYALLDGLIESVMFASPLRDASGALTDLLIGHLSGGFRDPAGRNAADVAGRPLLEVYPLAAVAGGLFDRAAEVLRTGEPQHVSGGMLGALVSDVGMAPAMDVRIARLFDGVVIAWRRVDEAERLASLLQHAERLGRIGGWEENLLTGEVRWTDPAFALFGKEHGEAIPLADLHTEVMAEDAFAIERFRDRLVREQKATAAAFRIVRAADESVRQMRVFAEPVTDPAGAVVAVRGAFQDVSTNYHTQVALTATRDQLADTEERAAEEHRLALRLQQAITPWSAERVAAGGLDIAARYRPAGAGHLVSGDWYDTVLLPGGQMLLVVGDIAGHGIDAVTGMVAMRNCLRGLAITGAGPAGLLSWLNQVACQLTDGIIGTAICGLYEPDARTLRWARAGHLPPVLVRDSQARELETPDGLLLGANPDSHYQEVTTPLRGGDALLLFTDGLIERRDRSIDDTMASLLAEASRPVRGIAEFADHLLGHADSDTGDDTCLVTVLVR
jgi:PAS domain-containing protein